MNNPFIKSNHATKKEDVDLVVKAQSGNKKALNSLIDKHRVFIYNIAWKMVRNQADAEDLTQEALIKVVTHLGQFEGRSSFTTWCYRIVTNHFLMSKRKKDEITLTSFDEMSEALENTPDKTLTEQEKNENRALIKEMNYYCMSGMLLCLTREQRLVYILGEMFNADHTIGSEILNISKGNFRLRLSRARSDLYNFMNNNCGLVNKSNPCRCHKNVTFAVNNKIIDNRNLLFNQKHFASFRNALHKDADKMVDIIDEKYAKLYGELPFKEDFEKKTFLKNIIEDKQIKDLMRLN
ncbi:RNA polymerase sigma factor [Flagellimonas meridianipacifica]|uniref:RNA polymerase sigma factor (Sigma-70 family) n=1 Tax=Flagellimonas meridianipacifica TaxID=1080225 RepID=A0A2T0M913_9FLAO|nr:RNA polymerase sigma factor [Allomuricauda pacifica]PRX53994.1 RNA polymerase sigma factor (sigma-70 family) [Allomuricauda pacifica]